MRSSLQLAFICLLLLLSANPAAAEKPSIDWLFLIDTSQSMIGRGGSANIFSEVKRVLKSFVVSANLGDTIALYTFDSQVVQGPSIYLGGEEDKRRLMAQIDGLQAQGMTTHTGEAFYEALARQGDLHRLPDRRRTGTIVLLTDGIEDTSDNPGAIQITDIEVPPKEERPYSIIIWLGSDVQQFASSTLSGLATKFEDQGRVLYYPKAQQIDKAVTELRHLSEEITGNRITVDTKKLDFGRLDVEKGFKSEPKEITVTSKDEAQVSMSLEDPAVELAGSSSVVNLVSGENRIPVALVVKDEIEGEFAPKLNLHRMDSEELPIIGSVELTYSLKRPSYFKEAVAGLLLLFGLTWGLYRARARRRLFGILHVSGQERVQEIDLSKLRQQRVRLVEILDIQNGWAGNDVELTVGKQEDGGRVVLLSNATGEVVLNDLRLGRDSVEELYNEDRLILGRDITIRYSGPERPERSEELRQASGDYGH